MESFEKTTFINGVNNYIRLEGIFNKQKKVLHLYTLLENKSIDCLNFTNLNVDQYFIREFNKINNIDKKISFFCMFFDSLYNGLKNKYFGASIEKIGSMIEKLLDLGNKKTSSYKNITFYCTRNLNYPFRIDDYFYLLDSFEFINDTLNNNYESQFSKKIDSSKEKYYGLENISYADTINFVKNNDDKKIKKEFNSYINYIKENNKKIISFINKISHRDIDEHLKFIEEENIVTDNFREYFSKTSKVEIYKIHSLFQLNVMTLNVMNFIKKFLESETESNIVILSRNDLVRVIFILIKNFEFKATHTINIDSEINKINNFKNIEYGNLKELYNLLLTNSSKNSCIDISSIPKLFQ